MESRNSKLFFIVLIIVIICLLSNSQDTILSQSKQNNREPKIILENPQSHHCGSDMCGYLKKNYNVYTPYKGFVSDPNEPKPSWYYPEMECNKF